MPPPNPLVPESKSAGAADAPVNVSVGSLNATVVQAVRASQKKEASKGRRRIGKERFEATRQAWITAREQKEAAHKDELDSLEIQVRRDENESNRRDMDARHEYAWRIFVLIVVWLIAILLTLIFQAFHFWTFRLSNSIVLALIGGTTASVLALFTIVAQYFFPSPEKKRRPFRKRKSG
jgi:hypothetical protein